MRQMPAAADGFRKFDLMEQARSDHGTSVRDHQIGVRSSFCIKIIRYCRHKGRYYITTDAITKRN